MARKSRANNALIISDTKNKMWNAGLYTLPISEENIKLVPHGAMNRFGIYYPIAFTPGIPCRLSHMLCVSAAIM